MSSPNLELIDYITRTFLESAPAHLSCSPPSPSLEYSLVKSTNDNVITDLANDLGLVNMEKEQSDGRANEFDRPLGNYALLLSLYLCSLACNYSSYICKFKINASELWQHLNDNVAS